MTPRLATDQSQNVIWRWDGAAFGNTPADEMGGFAINLRFPGQYYDAETGWHYNWHRYYDLIVGRYITSDPIGLTAGMNTYVYVNQNPLGSIDERGLLCGSGACLLGTTFTVDAVVGIAQGIATASAGGSFGDGFAGGFAFGSGATLTGIVGAGSVVATGLGVAVGFGLDLLVSGGGLLPDAEAAMTSAETTTNGCD